MKFMVEPATSNPSLYTKSSRSGVRLLSLLAVLAPAVFALSSNNIWEDFFITYRCSLNLVHGHGLVYEVGRTVHAFTSPLGTLLPAGINWMLNTDDPQRVIDAFRLAGCLALGGAWWLATCRIQGTIALAVTAGLWLLDAKLAAFSTNGMETAFLVFFVVLAWRALTDGDMRLAGIALGGAMWTRPDGFVFVGALATANWVLQRERWRDRSGWVRMAAWGACIYAPWFLWAWWYYGSPVPHTILAKRDIIPDSSGYFYALAGYPFRLLFGRTAADDAFMPAYFYLGGWPKFLLVWSKSLTISAVIAAAWRNCAPGARIAGLAFVLGGFYLEITPRAPWYFPAWEILAFIAIGGLAAALVEKGVLIRLRWGAVFAGGAAFLILTQGAVFVAVSVQFREQQRLIEWGLRASLGRDLRRLAASEGDTVFLEPLGYIGYYSGLAMRDTPGLCAPEVVALRRSGCQDMAALAVALGPDWVVLRGHELALMTASGRARFEQRYDYVGQYNVRPQVEAVAFLPGRDYLRFDAVYLLWHRKPQRQLTPSF